MSTTQTYAVTGMTCGHCETAVRSEVTQIPGVQEVDVSASTGRLSVTTDEPIEDSDVFTAVDEAGYRAERL
ncbi:heavy-metal-associated domain-containing protein [Aeromicrobium sp. CTD01-1L150]|uniref:heavy-metal-associated domain-containing protein n=1 Tax=Aeromicrobium sp. CTD01-1L150 TaxID=3341830 RepID=UPI0035C2023D